MATYTDKLLIKVMLDKRQAAKDLETLRASLSKVYKGAKKFDSKEVSTAVNKVAKDRSHAKKQQLRDEKDRLSSQMDAAKKIDAAHTKLVNNRKKEENSLARTQKENAHNSMRNFMMMKRNALQAGLSFMFAGMALKKMFEGIAQGAVTAYNKINANTELANNAITRLTVTMDYLNYVVGDAIAAALDSMMPTILSIVDSLANWIEDNEVLAGKLIVFGIIGSTIVMVLGQLGLAILGVMSALELLGIVKTGAAVAKIGTAATVAGTKVSKLSGLLTTLGNVAGLGIGIYLAWKGFSEMAEGGKDSNISQIMFSTIKAALGAALGVGFGAALLKFGVAASVAAGTVAFVATIGVGLTYLLFQTFKKAKDKTSIPNLGEEYDAAVSSTPPEIAQSQEDMFSGFKSSINKLYDSGETLQTLMLDTIPTWLTSQDSLADLSLDIGNNSSAIKNTMLVGHDNIAGSLDYIMLTQDKIATENDNLNVLTQDMTSNVTKTNENLSVLGNENFANTTGNIVDYVGDLESSFRSLSRINFSRILRDQQNSMDILSR